MYFHVHILLNEPGTFVAFGSTVIPLKLNHVMSYSYSVRVPVIVILSSYIHIFHGCTESVGACLVIVVAYLCSAKYSVSCTGC